MKFTELATERDTSGLKELQKEMKLKRKIIISRDKRMRRLPEAEVFPYVDFLKALWEGEIL